MNTHNTVKVIEEAIFGGISIVVIAAITPVLTIFIVLGIHRFFPTAIYSQNWWYIILLGLGWYLLVGIIKLFRNHFKLVCWIIVIMVVSWLIIL